jgi:hypothetical protein
LPFTAFHIAKFQITGRLALEMLPGDRIGDLEILFPYIESRTATPMPQTVVKVAKIGVWMRRIGKKILELVESRPLTPKQG